MNEPRLYRGKPKNPSEKIPGLKKDGFVYGYFVKLKRRATDEAQWLIQPVDKNGCPLCLVQVIPKTVGQSTGLKDKNGAEIFEGDIFEFDDEEWDECYTSCGMEYDSWPVVNRALVGINEDTQAPDFVQFLHNESSVNADLHENHDVEFYEFVQEHAIIGNIHDNPELLEVGE